MFSVGGPDGAVSDPDKLRWEAAIILDEEADTIEGEHGREAARTFVGIARGTATPLLLHMDAWLRDGGIKGPLAPRTAAQYRAAVSALAEWAKGVGVTTIEGFTDQMAGRFVTEELVGKGIRWVTANRRITAASAYWRWLRKRAGIKATPCAVRSGRSLIVVDPHAEHRIPIQSPQRTAACLIHPMAQRLTEPRNALARALFFNRLGELRDRRFENQVFRASGLNLLVAAIIPWNSRYLAAAFGGMR